MSTPHSRNGRYHGTLTRAHQSLKGEINSNNPSKKNNTAPSLGGGVERGKVSSLLQKVTWCVCYHVQRVVGADLSTPAYSSCAYARVHSAIEPLAKVKHTQCRASFVDCAPSLHWASRFSYPVLPNQQAAHARDSPTPSDYQHAS